MDQLPVIKPTHTSCKDCVFALYTKEQHDSDDLTQTGCLKGKIDIFQKREEVVDVVDQYDNKFFVVNGRLCPFFRSVESKWARTHKTFSERSQQVDEEVVVRPRAVIVTNETSTIRDVKETVENLITFGSQVRSVTVFLRPSSIPVLQLKDLLSGYPELNWSINRTVDSPKPGHDLTGFQLEIAFRSERGWALVTEAGKTLPSDHISNINTYLYRDLERFAIHTGQRWHGMVYHYNILHALANGTQSLEMFNTETKEAVTFDLFERAEEIPRTHEDYQWAVTDYHKVKDRIEAAV